MKHQQISSIKLIKIDENFFFFIRNWTIKCKGKSHEFSLIFYLKGSLNSYLKLAIYIIDKVSLKFEFKIQIEE